MIAQLSVRAAARVLVNLLIEPLIANASGLDMRRHLRARRE
jgi:hypothetical protein